MLLLVLVWRKGHLFFFILLCILFYFGLLSSSKQKHKNLPSVQVAMGFYIWVMAGEGSFIGMVELEARMEACERWQEMWKGIGVTSVCVCDTWLWEACSQGSFLSGLLPEVRAWPPTACGKTMVCPGFLSPKERRLFARGLQIYLYLSVMLIKGRGEAGVVIWSCFNPSSQCKESSRTQGTSPITFCSCYSSGLV